MYSRPVYFYALMVFLGIMSVSGTIALGNLLLVFLLIYSAWILLKEPQTYLKKTAQSASDIPLFIYVWIFYLIVFPLWAVDAGVAWANLRGPWLQSILTWILAPLVVAILGRQGPNLYLLAIVSAVPSLLHLFLTLLEWLNALTPEFNQNPSLDNLLKSLPSILQCHQCDWFRKAFPWGFRGVEPMHGNIGYAASQSTIISIACFLDSMRKSAVRQAVICFSLILACLFSALVASSRGTVYFNVIIFAMAIPLYLHMQKKQSAPLQARRPSYRKYAVTVIILFAVLALTQLSVRAYKLDARWGSMWDKIELGLQVDDPEAVLCNGLTAEEKDSIYKNYAVRGDDYLQVLIAGLEGQDGGRILLMREGGHLVLENPWGIDGSRQAYQKAIEKKCGHPPVLFFAHAHQAWMNLALSIGCIGAAIYACVLISFAVRGMRALSSAAQWPWGIALAMLAFFWILRGMADAVFQDHYLQMQAFFMTYIALRQKAA